MFTIHMLAADHGDCLWIEYGDRNRPLRILIDTGTSGTYERSLLPRIRKVVEKEGRCRFELFVVTHVDTDHIGAAPRFIDEAANEKVFIKEVWFNGFFHLSNQRPEELGALDGERLTELIRRAGLDWNTAFDRYAVMVPDTGSLPCIDVGGMKLTLLSPTFDKLQALKPTWIDVITKAGLVPGKAFAEEETVLGDGFLGIDIAGMAGTKFKQDSAAANGSSIAFLAEYEGVSVLFGADAHPSVLLDSVRRLDVGGVVPLTALKLPHHASRANVSMPLLAAFPADHYLVSTNGAHFRHPDVEALSRVVVAAKGRSSTLHFNYRSEFTKEWDDVRRRRDWGYSTRYPDSGDAGLLVRIR